MPEHPVIVNYAQLADALRRNPAFRDVPTVAPPGDATIADVAPTAVPPPPPPPLPSVTGAPDIGTSTSVSAFVRALRALREDQAHPAMLSSPDDPFAAALQSTVAEEPTRFGTVERLAEGGCTVKFADDPGWAETLVGLVKEKLGIGRFDFLPGPEEPTPIPDRTRVAILGDWGTNLYGAPHCAASILRDADAHHDIGAVIHLGDVYYSGTDTEIQERFLNVWPFIDGAVNRACNANHEMYSGGRPYAKRTLPAFDQSSSLFLLANAHWMLVGIDTAYADGTIYTKSLAWIDAVTTHAAKAGQKVVLLSHHQPWTTNGSSLTSLTDPILDLLEEKRVTAWYWGHEHLCSLWEQHRDWGLYGGCIGHSGFPYERLTALTQGVQPLPQDDATAAAAQGAAWYPIPENGKVPAGVLLDGPNPCMIDGHQDHFGPNGYAVLELDGPSLVECIYSATGVKLHERTIA